MDLASFHEAALAYLARRPASAAQMVRVLERRARRAGVELADAQETIRGVVARLVEVGLVDDAAFAASRVRRLGEGGKSTRAIAAHLAAKGVSAEVARAALSRDGDPDLDAALQLARKRRFGPFARDDAPPDRATEHKILGVFARAGFDRRTAERALRMARDEAERRLEARRGLS